MATASKHVSQPPSITSSSHVPASPTNTVSTVAGRGISAATSTASARPIVGAQPLTYDFYKRYREAYGFYKAHKSSEAIDVLVEILEKAKGYTFAPNDLCIVESQLFLAILYQREGSDLSIDYAQKAIEGIGTIFANKASWNQAAITSTYKELWKVLHELKLLIPQADPMQQNIKENLAICKEELRHLLSEKEFEELRIFHSSREGNKGSREVSLFGIFALFALTAVVFALYFNSRSIVKIS